MIDVFVFVWTSACWVFFGSLAFSTQHSTFIFLIHFLTHFLKLSFFSWSTCGIKPCSSISSPSLPWWSPLFRSSRFLFHRESKPYTLSSPRLIRLIGFVVCNMKTRFQSEPNSISIYIIPFFLILRYYSVSQTEALPNGAGENTGTDSGEATSYTMWASTFCSMQTLCGVYWWVWSPGDNSGTPPERRYVMFAVISDVIDGYQANGYIYYFRQEPTVRDPTPREDLGTPTPSGVIRYVRIHDSSNFSCPYDRTDLFNLDQSSRAQCKSKIVFFKNLTSSLIGNSTWI